MLRWGACMAFAVLAGMTLPVAAGPLDDAKAQVAASDYMKARASLDAAYASGTNSPEQLAEIWKLRGIVAGALDETKPATEAFQRALALDPKVELPPGTSPKFTRPFSAAQDWFKKKEPLRIKQESTSGQPSIAISVLSDPMNMIARIVVTVHAEGVAEDKKLDAKNAGQDKIEFTLPTAPRLDLRIAAVDEKGNRLAELGSLEVPIVIVGKQPDNKPDDKIVVTPPPDKPVQPYKERPLYKKWWLWAGGAVLFAGAATYFGIDGVLAKGDLEDLNAESSNHSFDEAKDLENRARRDFLFANIGYGVAGALAITAGILWLTEPDRPQATEKRVTAIPLEGGGAIVLGGHF